MHTAFKKTENSPAVCKADFHLGGMDVDIYLFGRHSQVQDRKGKAMLHKVGPIAFLKTGGKFFAAQHSSVDKKGLKTPAGSADLGSSQKTVQYHTLLRILGMYRYNSPRSLAAVDPVDQFPQVSVSCGVKFILSVYTVMEGNQWM